MRTGKARTGLSARLACHRRWNAYGNCLPFGPEVGAVCGKAARTALCGGREVTRVPTASRNFCSRTLLHLLRSPIGTKQEDIAMQKVVRYRKCCGPGLPAPGSSLHDPKRTIGRIVIQSPHRRSRARPAEL